LNKNITVEGYIESAIFAEEWGISVNDALVYLTMKRKGVN